MTPTLAQRFWLQPVRLPLGDRRRLHAARAAFLIFALQPTVALAAAAASGTVAAPGLAATACSYFLGFAILIAYERIPVALKVVAATCGAVVISTFVLFQPHGELYSLLNVGLVFYICFFFGARRAAVPLGLVLAVVASTAVAAADNLQVAGELLVMNMGALGGTAAITIVIRRRLVAALTDAQRTSATLDAFFRHSSTGFAFLDAELRHVRVNSPLAEMLHIPADQLVGKTIREIAPHLADALEPLLRRVLETGQPLEGLELASPDGKRHYLVSYFTTTGPDGTRGLGETVVDVTRLKDVERRLEETNKSLTVLATTDELTQLPNRRMLGEQLDLALARARRSGLAVAVLCLDLDRFKDVNDTLGHAYGDQVLVEIAGRLRAGARETDVVARVGGDEFVVLLADLDVQEAPALAVTVVERIGQSLRETLAIGPVELKVDASIGVAIYPLDSRDAKGMLAVADAAMYAGKGPLARTA